MKRYVVVGDIHGYYDVLMKTLDSVHFNPEEDCFIGLGDYFDGGTQNIKVFNFLKSLPNKRLIMGNHDVYLCQCLRECAVDHYDFRNNTTCTLCEFAGVDLEIGEQELFLGLGKDIFDKVNAYNLIDFYKENAYWYYETPHYIFTHGWFPITGSGKIAPKLDKISDKRWLRAAQGNSIDAIRDFMENYPNGYDKTIVVGHWAADNLKYNFQDESFGTLDKWNGEKFIDKQHKIIGLDSTIELTNSCDCLIIPEDEI